MKFKKLFVKNFMTFRKTSINLEEPGLILLIGVNKDNPSCTRNGSGKSSLWDALVWTIYGKPIRNIAIEKIRNRWTSKGTVGRVTFSKESHLWMIKRTRGVKSNPTLDLFCDGQNVSANGSTATQRKIDSLFGMDFGAFCTAVIFGQETLRFAKLTDKERKAVLEKLLGLEIYEKACHLARQEQAGHRMTMELNHASYAKAKERLEEIRKKLREEKKKLKKTKSQVRINVEKAEEQLEELRRLTKKHYKRSHRIAVKAEKLREIVNARQNRIGRMAELKDEYNELNEQVQEVQAKILSVKDEKQPLCPTCKQAVKERSKKEVLRSLEKERTELSDRMNVSNRLYKKLASKTSKGKKLSLKYNRLCQLLDKGRAWENETGRQVNSLHLQISFAKKTPDYNKKAIETVRESLRQAKKDLKSAKSDAKAIERKLDRAKFWIEGFGHHGLRSYLMDEVIPFLNERASHYARTLVDGHIKIRFSPVEKKGTGEESDRLVIIAKNKDGADVYEGNSAGERQRIDLAIALALKDLARSRSQSRIDLMVFDEVFENLDESGCERVISLLNQEKESLGTCFVITHNESLKPYFSKRVEVVKEGRISTCLMN